MKKRCGVGEAYVFGGDVGIISWIATEEFEGGYFVQWIAVEDETHIWPALQSEEFQKLLDGEDAEHTLIEVCEPGMLRVIQAAGIGDDLVDPSLSIQLRPGTYRATSVYLATSTLAIVVRKLTLE
ncbi:MAG: hypothetical protein ABJM43_15490 [Paracoccaceae bacterium]